MTLAGGRFSATRFLSRVGLDRVPIWALSLRADRSVRLHFIIRVRTRCRAQVGLDDSVGIGTPYKLNGSVI